MKYFKLFENYITEAKITDIEDELISQMTRLGYDADAYSSPAGRTLYAYKEHENGWVQVYVETTDPQRTDYSVVQVQIAFVPMYFVKRFFGLKKRKGLDFTQMKSLLPGDQKNQIIDLGVGLFDRSAEDNVKDIMKLVKDADKEYDKEYKNYVPNLKESELNEDNDSNEPVDVLSIIKKKQGKAAAEAFKNTFIEGFGWDNQDFDALKQVFDEVGKILKARPMQVKGAQRKDLQLNWDYLDEYIYDVENPGG